MVHLLLPNGATVIQASSESGLPKVGRSIVVDDREYIVSSVVRRLRDLGASHMPNADTPPRESILTEARLRVP